MDSNGRGINPTFAKVDAVLDLLTKSKSLHILLVLDQTNTFEISQIKSVNSSSTTVSRRLKELRTLFDRQENS